MREHRMTLVLALLPLVAQLPSTPHGMYCGGNEMRFEEDLKGSSVAGAIFAPTGVAIPRARVQVQIQGRWAVSSPRIASRAILAGDFERRLQTSLLAFDDHSL